MKIFYRWLILLALVLPAFSAWAQTVNGNLDGTFTGNATDGSASYSGSIEGNWTATGTFDATGNFVETVTGSGTFGGLGIAGSWQATAYDPITKTISVSWAAPGNRGPSGGTADGSVALVVDTATGIATGAFNGQFYTPNGVKSIAGTWTVQFRGAANSVVTGTIQGSFSGSASYVGNVSGVVTGSWLARFQPDGSVSGTASGSFDGGNIAVAGYGSICICGTWIASVSQGSNGQYQLVGSWTQPIISGSLDGSGGGPIVWYIDTSVVPIQASGTFAGSTTFTVPLPLPLSPMSVPVAASGSWTATLPLTP